MADFKVAWRKRVYVLPIPSQHKVVLLALGEYADWTTHGGAHPGTKRLCADTGYSDKTIQRALAAGIEHGLLAQTARGHNTSKGRSVANKYDLCLGAKSQQVPAVQLAEPTGQSSQANGSVGASQQVTAVHLPSPTSTPRSTPTPQSDLGLDPDLASPQAVRAERVQAPATIERRCVRPEHHFGYKHACEYA
jgi:hypothetical protein